MCRACQIDTNKADAFAGKLLDGLNSAGMMLMISIGHRSGLFDTMEHMEPSTSAQIAAKAGLNERYVREWLGAMTTSGVVECDPAGPTFRLPAEHAAFTTRAADADNMAVFAQYFPVLGRVEDEVLECFQQGGGVPYSAYPRFHAVMAEDSGQSVLSSLNDKILPIVPGIIERLQAGIDVLDIGCGSGRALQLMAQTFPKSRFHGYDLSQEAISRARAEAKQKGLTNIEFTVRDLSNFHDDAPQQRFDFITAFDAIHDQARPDRVLAGIRRALKDDGTFLMQDISASSTVTNNINHPLGTFIYAISTMHCMTVSLAQGGLGLGAAWGREKAEEMLTEAGFSGVDVQSLPHDFQNFYYIVKP